MKKLLTIIFFVAALIPSFAQADKPIVADLAVRSIDIDHNFIGMDILLFGARNDVGRIVVVVRGPERDYIVRKKEKIAGIWVNKESVHFDGVNSFYAIASTSPLDDVKNNQLLSALGIGVDNIRLKTSSKNLSADDFRRAFIHQKQTENLYMNTISKVTFWGETLFRTVLKFPKNIEGGWYTAEVYLFNNGILSAVQSTPILVEKTGFEAFIYDIAHSYSFIYGLLCVLMAITAGWMANAIFGRM